jgi:hypothetical protein
MEGFIRENYREKVLALQHNHMSRYYFVGLLKKLLEILEVQNLDVNQGQLVVPGEGQLSVCPLEFKFFRNYFPDLGISKSRNSKPVENLVHEFLKK